MANRILLVDDEPAIVKIYRVALREKFDVEIATDPQEALELVRQKGPFAVVVSDMQMPGMCGIELLGRIREQHEQTVGILMTGHADARTAIQAINEGEIFRFLDKTHAGTTLETALDAAVRHHELLTAEAELLSSTLSGSVRMLVQVLSLAMPEAFGLAHEAKTLSRSIAVRLGVEPLWQIEMAAMLMRVGCVALPHDVLCSYLRCDKLNPDQQRLVCETPEIGYQLVSAIPRLQGVAELIRAQQCPPTCDTPLGARILRVVNDFQRLQQHTCSLIETLMRLQDRSSYDKSVVQQLSDIVSVECDRKYVSIEELQIGMILDSHIERASDNAVIIAKGTEIHDAMIQKLCMLRRNGVSIGEPICVIMTDPQQTTDIEASSQVVFLHQ